MLSTNLPDGSWQRQSFDATLTYLIADDPPVRAFVQLVQPTPEQLEHLIARSDQAWNDLLGQHASVPPGEDFTQTALTMTLREFYQAVGGEAVVREHAPHLLPAAPKVSRPVGRPRTTPLEPPAPLPVVAPPAAGVTSANALDGHGDALRIDAEDVLASLRDEMRAFAAHLASTRPFFDDLQLGDTLVRTWSPQDAAALIGVTPVTLANWRQRGVGPKFVTTGSRVSDVRYPVFRVVQWLVGEDS